MNHSARLTFALMLIAAASTAQAHLTGNHAMSITAGLHHLLTEPSHWILLIPALGILLIWRLIESKANKP
jgi:hydrogenase/urease accessory protein HupE